MSEAKKQSPSELKFERLCKLLTRIKRNSMVGGDFEELMDYLKELEGENYEVWLVDAPVRDGVHKGYAKAISELREAFATCDSGKYAPPVPPESQN